MATQLCPRCKTPLRNTRACGRCGFLIKSGVSQAPTQVQSAPAPQNTVVTNQRIKKFDLSVQELGSKILVIIEWKVVLRRGEVVRFDTIGEPFGIIPVPEGNVTLELTSDTIFIINIIANGICKEKQEKKAEIPKMEQPAQQMPQANTPAPIQAVPTPTTVQTPVPVPQRQLPDFCPTCRADLKPYKEEIPRFCGFCGTQLRS